MSQRVQVDYAPVSREKAAELVVHHLAMAAGLFQALEEDTEMETLGPLIDEQFQGWRIEGAAARAFVVSLNNSYLELKFEDGESQQEE